MPGGEALTPGGGVALPTGRGGVPYPGGYWVGAPATLAETATTAAAPVLSSPLGWTSSSSDGAC